MKPPLTTTHPELAAQWHPTLNGDLRANMVTAGSEKKAWWLGECGHEWDMSIGKRVARHQNCPYCSNQRILVGYNDLATTHPELAAQWHPTLNGDLTPEKVSKGNGTKVWWLGECEHEWDMVINKRTVRCYNCPYCSNQRILTGYNDFSTTHPQLTAEWHPTKNGDLAPQHTTAGGNKPVWWQCKLGHEWVTAINSRGMKNSGCPTCTGKRILIGFNDLTTANPELASQWHPTLNGELTPEMVTPGSGKKVWWVCSENHEWDATIASRAKNQCPVCGGQKVWTGKTDLATIQPDLAAQWHPTKNGVLTPEGVTPASRLNVWWLGTCGLEHEWQSQIVHMGNGQGQCLVCIGKRIKVGYNDLATTHPQLANEWHPIKNGKVHITAVSKGITKLYWWLGKCGHEWKASPNSRARKGRPRGCPYCANQKVLIGFNDLYSQDPGLAVQWHPTLNGELTSEMVVVNSSKKVWWQCTQGHEWQTMVSSRRSGSGCHTCTSARTVSSSEQGLADYVISLGVKVIQSDHSLIHKELDLYLPELNVAIEYNGLYYHSEKKGIGAKYHRDKWLRCKNKGVDLIQIWEDEWINKSELVKRLLADRLLSNQEHISVKNHTISKLDGDYAREFLHRNSLKNIELDAEEYYGLSSLEGNLHAVVGINFDEDNASFEITYCATSILLEEAFLSMILEQITQESGVHHFQVIEDHCFSFAELYERSGFTVQSEQPPSFMYVKQLTRSTSPQSKEKDGLNRIWDAGSTRWVRNR